MVVGLDLSVKNVSLDEILQLIQDIYQLPE
ncbi:hypothetical protein CLV42_113139 [Chitinophaga ginsengisoli]|uniref:Uncharacterized protein n=1 Tax=Chitinophaga ginsengisoli TaxID=363837 RepID=A0A2P8FUR7_9BACT|nr:hypothetical protein CLV42_113139 [Chitinophaga ginsengisoli]